MTTMYGLQATMLAKPGQRAVLLQLLLEGSRGSTMPGCRLYVVSEVPAHPDAIAILEVWDDEAAHDASLQLASVQALIAKARPLIAGMGDSLQLRPIGGQGLD